MHEGITCIVLERTERQAAFCLPEKGQRRKRVIIPEVLTLPGCYPFSFPLICLVLTIPDLEESESRGGCARSRRCQEGSKANGRVCLQCGVGGALSCTLVGHQPSSAKMNTTFILLADHFYFWNQRT